MRFRALILLSLSCFSAFAEFLPYYWSIEIGETKFQIGKDAANCAVRRTQGSETPEDKVITEYNGNGICSPLGMYQTDKDIWVVLQITGDQDILSNNALSAETSFTEVVSWSDANSIPDIIVVAQINTAGGANFGKFTAGSYLGTKLGSKIQGFSVLDVAKCGTTIQIQGYSESAFQIVGVGGVLISDDSGTETIMIYDTKHQTVEVSNANETCSGRILSILSSLFVVLSIIVL